MNLLCTLPVCVCMYVCMYVSKMKGNSFLTLAVPIISPLSNLDICLIAVLGQSRNFSSLYMLFFQHRDENNTAVSF